MKHGDEDSAQTECLDSDEDASVGDNVVKHIGEVAVDDETAAQEKQRVHVCACERRGRVN